MHASKWPFGDRPATNTLIQLMIAMVIGGVFIMFPGPAVAVAVTVVGLRGARGLYRALRREWFPPKPSMLVIGAEGTRRLDDTDEGKLFKMIGVKHICPDCKSKEGFYDGPCGGMSQNIFCINPRCRSGFNITYFGGDQGTVDRISKGDLDRYTIDDALKATIRAEEAKAAEEAKPKPECGTCHAPLDATGMCPNN